MLPVLTGLGEFGDWRGWFNDALYWMTIFKFVPCIIALPFHYIENILKCKGRAKIHCWLYDNIIHKRFSLNWRNEENVDLLILINCSQIIIEDGEWLGVV